MMTVYVGKEGRIRWELNRRTHVMELQGKGSLPDFHPFLGDLPGWTPVREHFREVRVGQGVSRIGDYAFYPYDHGVYADMCAPLCRIIFSPGLESIGRSAFRANTRLSFIDLRGLVSLRSIEEHAFASCFGAKAADLSGCIRLEALDPQAFWGCDELDYINLKGCRSLTGKTLRAIRKETPSHVPIIMPDGSISCHDVLPGHGERKCKVLLGGTRHKPLIRGSSFLETK